MAKFHIGKRGVPALCRAKGQCPLGADEPHGQTKEEVQTIIDSYCETAKAINEGEELQESKNSFETSGRLKALREKQKELVKKINDTETHNKNIFYSNYGTIEEIETAIASNPDRIAEEQAYLDKRKSIRDEQEAYKEKALEEIKQNNPFGERLTITETGKLFVKEIKKDEWPAYNEIKDKLQEIKNKEQQYIDSSFVGMLKKAPLRDNEIKEMQADLEKLKKQEEPIDNSKNIAEYEKISSEIKKHEKLYKEQLFEERTGHKLSELKPVLNEVSNDVRIDETGQFTNVYAQNNGETYKVLRVGHDSDDYSGIGKSYLEVETLNGDKKELSMTTTWNWRMKTSHDAYESLPNVYTVEEDKGKLSKEPVKFPKIMIDSSD